MVLIYLVHNTHVYIVNIEKSTEFVSLMKMERTSLDGLGSAHSDIKDLLIPCGRQGLAPIQVSSKINVPVENINLSIT